MKELFRVNRNDYKREENIMVDFEKLNAMIDEVNNVITDVENETSNIKNKVYDSVALAYDYVCEELVKYCGILNKACDSSCSETYRNIKASFEIPIQNPTGKIVFKYECPTYAPTYAFRVKVLVVNDNGKLDSYRIIYTCRANDYVGVESYEAVNRSHSAIKWFLQICNDWNSYKSEVENAVVNAVNDILKQKSEFAHQDNIKAKSDLELVKGRAEEIYAEFDNN